MPQMLERAGKLLTLLSPELALHRVHLPASPLCPLLLNTCFGGFPGEPFSPLAYIILFSELSE